MKHGCRRLASGRKMLKKMSDRSVAQRQKGSVRGRVAAQRRGASATGGPPKHASAHTGACARARVPHSPPHSAAAPARRLLSTMRRTHPKMSRRSRVEQPPSSFADASANTRRLVVSTPLTRARSSFIHSPPSSRRVIANAVRKLGGDAVNI